MFFVVFFFFLCFFVVFFPFLVFSLFVHHCHRVCYCVCIYMYIDAIERLREFTDLPDAWGLAYENVLDADLSRVPQCTQQLMVLMKEITGV